MTHSVSQSTDSTCNQEFDEQGMVMREDFAKIVRRIMYSNSGRYHKMESPPETKQVAAQKVMPVGNADWDNCRQQAELAAAYGNREKARQMWLDALAVAETFSPMDPRLAFTLDNVASLYAASGDYLNAEQYLRRAVSILETVYGVSHLKVANSLNSLAGVYYYLGRFELAEPLCMRALTIYNEALGPDHPDVGVAANNLAMIYHAQNRLGLAELLYERALPIRKKALGSTHEQVRILMQNYANVLERTDRQSKAEGLRAEARSSGIWHLFDNSQKLEFAPSW